MFISHSSLALIRPTYPAIGFRQDFTNTAAALPANITFTRSTTANRFNSAGTLTSTAIDVARANANQDYNPFTLAARGFLIEAGATNLLTYSEQFNNADWTKAACSITANAVVAPDGATTADKVAEDSATTNHYVLRNPSFTSGTAYTASVYAKAAERGQIHIQVGGVAAFGALTWAVFSLSDGSVVASNNTPTTAAQQLPNGWWRFSVSKTATATGAPQLQIGPAVAGSSSYAGDGTSGIYIWGAQLEANAFATSYVKSEGSATARGADLPRVATLSSIGYNSTQGSLSGQVMFRGVGSSSTRRIASFNDGTTNNEIAIVMADGGSDLIRFVVTSGGVTQADISSTVTAVANTLYKWAISWNANSFRISVNSTAGTEVTSGTVPTVDRLTLGTDGAGANSVNGWLPEITYYPMQLSQAQMNGITA
jgi:hypothetical protein